MKKTNPARAHLLVCSQTLFPNNPLNLSRMKKQLTSLLCFVSFRAFLNVRVNKYAFALLMFCMFSYTLSAQNTIVRVRGGVSAVFTTLDEALTDQANGDYFNLSGGVFTTNKPIEKGIHIVGAGYYASTAATGATGVTRIASNIFIYTGADNGSIEGVEINNDIYFGSGGSVAMQVTGFLIKRCYLVDILNFLFQSHLLIYFVWF